MPLAQSHGCVAYDLWLLRPVAVNLLWLVGAAGRPSIAGLVTVALEEGVLGATVLGVELILFGGARLVPLTCGHSP